MRIQDKSTGVLEAVNKRNGGFDESDVRVLSIIASQAAVAINNARLVEALQKAYDELGKVDKIKTDFIAIASHELRTPLGMVLGYASLLKEETGEATSEYASAVLNSALRMRSLIEDMTNMNMLRIGSAEMSFEATQLGSILEAAHQEMADLIRAKGQSVELHISEEALEANLDGPKMIMALTNLINNAIRFTPPEGQIWLNLERRGSEAWFRVRDNGIGIPSERLESIFDQFYQVEEHMTRRHEGMGLGLAIVRAIVEAHGGRVWAESEGVNKGACVTIALPLMI